MQLDVLSSTPSSAKTKHFSQIVSTAFKVALMALKFRAINRAYKTT